MTLIFPYVPLFEKNQISNYYKMDILVDYYFNHDNYKDIKEDKRKTQILTDLENDKIQMLRNVDDRYSNEKILIRLLKLDGDNHKDFMFSHYDPEDSDYTNDYEENIKYCIDNQIWPLGRFRDISVSKNGYIKVFSRIGSGNREYHKYVFDILEHHPEYISEKECCHDHTYVIIKFNIPKIE